MTAKLAEWFGAEDKKRAAKTLGTHAQFEADRVEVRERLALCLRDVEDVHNTEQRASRLGLSSWDVLHDALSVIPR